MTVLLQSRGSRASSRRNRATSSLALVSLGPERTSQSVAEMKDFEVMDVVRNILQLALGWRGRPRIPAHTGAPLHRKCQARVGAASVTLHLSVIVTVISNLAATGDAMEQVSVPTQSTPHTDERSSYAYPQENILSTLSAGAAPPSSVPIHTTFKLSPSY